MTDPLSSALVPDQSFEDKDTALAGRLAEEMAERWRKGERPAAEEFLDRHPGLWDHPEGAIRLIYEEVCLRQEQGEGPATQEVIHRFPQWRAQLEVLLGCHRLLQAGTPAPIFPRAGDSFGEYHLLRELGRGAQGRVFLATQPFLAGRTVVVKVIPRAGGEHLSLARLQHTHIVPLYAVQDFPEQHLRALCMPYLGGATLDRVLPQLREQPPAGRKGGDLVRAIDGALAGMPPAVPARGPGRQFLAHHSYVQAVCWMGVALADALSYAHEHGLVHLDLKPSNVLLTAEGQPMLLDFHLAREPLTAGGPAPDWLGGTPQYMSPEQQLALNAVRTGQPVPVAVDGCSDIYSLGVLLYEALEGTWPGDAGTSPPASLRFTSGVSVGLADVLRKCLAPEAKSRYGDATALAGDLRRHLADLPLQGVANRSLNERWRKWRRRKPQALARLLLGAAVLAASLGVLGLEGAYLRRQWGEAQQALTEGRSQVQEENYRDGERTLQHGLELANGLPGSRGLVEELDRQRRTAVRGEAAQELHRLADQLRLYYGVDSLTPAQGKEMAVACQTAWAARARILGPSGPPLAPGVEAQIQTDLRDLVILWADLSLRLPQSPPSPETLPALQEAERLFGPSLVLERERQALAEALGKTAPRTSGSVPEPSPQNAWEHYALGRFHLQSGNLKEAETAFHQALDLQPQDFWANFYQGTCAYREQEYQEAVNAFRVCIALAPDRAECYYNRARAYTELGRVDLALRDYDRALEINPGLGEAARNRGLLHYREKHYPEALADLHRALDHGAEPARVYYNLALIYQAQKDRPAALTSLHAALARDPDQKEARALLDQLRTEFVAGGG